MQNNPLPTVTLTDIRGVYAHLPNEAPDKSVMRHPAYLVFTHDMQDAANAPGQSFLTQNNDPATRARQPLAVAADMTQADFKIFDLTPPERIALPCTEHDLALALSYGMVTVEQGVDFLALFAIGESSDAHKDNIASLGDLSIYGALNVAACYGACLAASMAKIAIVAPSPLARCLTRIAESENVTLNIEAVEGPFSEVALDLIRRKALAAM